MYILIRISPHMHFHWVTPPLYSLLGFSDAAWNENRTSLKQKHVTTFQGSSSQSHLGVSKMCAYPSYMSFMQFQLWVEVNYTLGTIRRHGIITSFIWWNFTRTNLWWQLHVLHHFANYDMHTPTCVCVCHMFHEHILKHPTHRINWVAWWKHVNLNLTHEAPNKWVYAHILKSKCDAEWN